VLGNGKKNYANYVKPRHGIIIIIINMHLQKINTSLTEQNLMQRDHFILFNILQKQNL